MQERGEAKWLVDQCWLCGQVSCGVSLGALEHTLPTHRLCVQAASQSVRSYLCKLQQSRVWLICLLQCDPLNIALICMVFFNSHLGVVENVWVVRDLWVHINVLAGKPGQPLATSVHLLDIVDQAHALRCPSMCNQNKCKSKDRCRRTSSKVSVKWCNPHLCSCKISSIMAPSSSSVPHTVDKLISRDSACA